MSDRYEFEYILSMTSTITSDKLLCFKKSGALIITLQNVGWYLTERAYIQLLQHQNERAQ